MNAISKAEVKVSFIVPIYKVEKYIQRCVKSIMDQSYRNIEIILVDDGSPDASMELISGLAKKDMRIKVIHQENAGVSTARNSGLDVAVGEYIVFVDGDDYIESDYTEYFLGLIKDADMAVGLNHYRIHSDTQIAVDNPAIWKDSEVIESIYLGKIDVAVWNKLYKKSVLDGNGIRFHTDIWYGEGMLFNIEYLQKIDCVAIGERKVYHQVFNPDSAMRKFNLKSNLCGIRSMEIQKGVWKKQTPEIEKAWKYHYRNFSRSIINGLVAIDAVEENRELYNQCKKNMRKDILLPWQVDIPLSHKIKLTVCAISPYTVAKYSKGKGIKAAMKQEKLLSKQ